MDRHVQCLLTLCVYIICANKFVYLMCHDIICISYIKINVCTINGRYDTNIMILLYPPYEVRTGDTMV